MRRLLFAIVCLILCPVSVFSQGATVGVYMDVDGTDCQLLDPSAGLITYYIVAIAPGATAVQFAAPRPPCFTATYLSDTSPFPVVIGNSQTDVSIGYGACLTGAVHVLSIAYFGSGTTPSCCFYPVIPGNTQTDVILVDCAANIFAGRGLSHPINGTSACLCSSANPGVPNNPSPANGATGQPVGVQLAWDVNSPAPLTFDVYFGTTTTPPRVASDITVKTFVPGTLNFNTTYYWRIVSTDSTTGGQSSGPVWSFSTADATGSRLTVSEVLNYCGLVTSDTISFDISIENAPMAIDAAGIDITYDSALLTLVSCAPGNLTASWQQFDYADLGNAVRIGGYDTSSAIRTGASGVFATLTFVSDCCALTTPMSAPLCPVNPTDDLTSLDLICGLFRCDVFLPDGDVNADGQVTPGDAQCGFAAFLSFPEPPATGCGPPGWDVRADVNCDGVLTPIDALCVFENWLDGSCTFCADSTSAPSGPVVVASGEATVSITDIRIEEGEMIVPIRVEGLYGFEAFGFDLVYPHGEIEYVGLVRTAVTRNFEEYGGLVVSEGRLRLGGYGTDAIDLTGGDDIVEVRFRLVSDSPAGSIILNTFVDDLGGASPVVKNLGPSGNSPIAFPYTLHQNHPNPFNPVTEISYEIPDGADVMRVTLTIYDANGKRVENLVDTRQGGGIYNVRWFATNDRGQGVPSGVYFYVLRAGSETLTRKMVFLK